MRTVICMKWGTKYGPRYVNRLYAQVRRNLASHLRFICFCDDSTGLGAGIEAQPLPPWDIDQTRLALPGMDTWRKISLYQPGLADMHGDILYLDLDVVITASLDDLFRFHAGKFCIIHDWMERRRLWRRLSRAGADTNSSVFRFNPDRHGFIFDDFVNNPAQKMDRHRIEQQYVGDSVTRAGVKVYWPGEWIASFKRQCIPLMPTNLWRQPKKPKGARIIVFHGHPLPHEAIAGHPSRRLDRYCRPTPWLRAYWQ